MADNTNQRRRPRPSDSSDVGDEDRRRRRRTQSVLSQRTAQAQPLPIHGPAQQFPTQRGSAAHNHEETSLSLSSSQPSSLSIPDETVHHGTDVRCNTTLPSGSGGASSSTSIHQSIATQPHLSAGSNETSRKSLETSLQRRQSQPTSPFGSTYPMAEFPAVRQQNILQPSAHFRQTQQGHGAELGIEPQCPLLSNSQHHQYMPTTQAPPGGMHSALTLYPDLSTIEGPMPSSEGHNTGLSQILSGQHTNRPPHMPQPSPARTYPLLQSGLGPPIACPAPSRTALERGMAYRRQTREPEDMHVRLFAVRNTASGSDGELGCTAEGATRPQPISYPSLPHMPPSNVDTVMDFRATPKNSPDLSRLQRRDQTHASHQPGQTHLQALEQRWQAFANRYTAEGDQIMDTDRPHHEHSSSTCTEAVESDHSFGGNTVLYPALPDIPPAALQTDAQQSRLDSMDATIDEDAAPKPDSHAAAEEVPDRMQLD